MPHRRAKIGNLQRRIAAGKAEPISDHERQQLEQIRIVYKERFGRDPVARPAPARSTVTGKYITSVRSAKGTSTTDVSKA